MGGDDEASFYQKEEENIGARGRVQTKIVVRVREPFGVTFGCRSDGVCGDG